LEQYDYKNYKPENLENPKMQNFIKELKIDSQKSGKIENLKEFILEGKELCTILNDESNILDDDDDKK